MSDLTKECIHAHWKSVWIAGITEAELKQQGVPVSAEYSHLLNPEFCSNCGIIRFTEAAMDHHLGGSALH